MSGIFEVGLTHFREMLVGSHGAKGRNFRMEIKTHKRWHKKNVAIGH